MGEDMCGYAPTLKLAQDRASVVPRAGVDEHVANEVGVYRIRRERFDHVDVVGEAFHSPGEPIGISCDGPPS